MHFESFSNDVEVVGFGLDSYKELSGFRAFKDIFLKYGINFEAIREWYPLQKYLECIKEVYNTFGKATLFYIGCTIVEETPWPKEINSLEDALFAINNTYKMNHRGNANIGSYETSKLNDDQYLIRCSSPYPSYFDMGIIKGICNKFSNKKNNVFVEYASGEPSRLQGAKSCYFIVTLSKNMIEKKDWINCKPVLMSEVLKENYRVMNNIANTLESRRSETEERNEKLAQANKKLFQLATIDELTGIANRRAFNTYIHSEWDHAKRYNNDLTLIICDIDHFKKINDQYGHQVGDQCIRYMANLLKNNIKRSKDFVARIGGEEFAIVLPDTPVNGALHIAETIRENIVNPEAKLTIPDLHITLTLSFGVSARSKTTNTLDELIRNSDSALYQAKAAGRNCVKYL